MLYKDATDHSMFQAMAGLIGYFVYSTATVGLATNTYQPLL